AGGATGRVAGTGQHDATHVAVVASRVQGIDQLVAGLPAKGVHLLGPVDGDPGHAVADFVENVFVVHVQFLFADAYASAVHGEAAGNGNHLACDEAGVVAGEERDGACEIVGLA